jgi:3-phenylpropionate/cinnamic acid dioxygenase small subunit
MSAPLTRAEAEERLYREALLIDSRRWDEWLAMFCDDIEFHMPAWRDETTLTQDPDRELSLIYYRGRRNLEDRVMRATSGLSTASTPLPRAVHAVTNVLVLAADRKEAHVSACFTCHRFDVRFGRAEVFFGRYDYRLRHEGGAWKIARKTIILLNDTIPTVADIFSV